ncbi:MAG TPA: YdeI/OmpD-associated family protein [Acidobacteriaceae bacterium]
MPTNPQVDAYIAKTAAFAQPLLKHVRELVHSTVPEVDEVIKWRMPFFTLDGKILGNMAAFKEHCSFGLWSAEVAALMKKKDSEPGEAAMGSFGKLKSVKDLPPDKELRHYILVAAAAVQAGESVMKRRATVAKPEIAMHPLFAVALKKAKAMKSFEAFAPSCRREYLEWVAEAKRDETRAKRVSQAVEWIGEGKKLHWKYDKG